ncbi:hypothetical protein NQ318_015281 [Aromia moschata]|uniref:DDE-1 domain-containing protein n=1 Tax=Aromia moschata TaxID=1265417 RepID=A0AAV8XE75_9CUCU|nr:hypothetical protein NQ318_015281 [Aromia moschata]
MNAVGSYILPFLIFGRVRMKPELLNGCPPGSDGRAEPSGWMTAETCLALKHFAHYTKPSIEDPVLLLVDNHSSLFLFQESTNAEKMELCWWRLVKHWDRSIEIETFIETENLRAVFDDLKRIFNCDETAFFLSPKECQYFLTRDSDVFELRDGDLYVKDDVVVQDVITLDTNGNKNVESNVTSYDFEDADKKQAVEEGQDNVPNTKRASLEIRYNLDYPISFPKQVTGPESQLTIEEEKYWLTGFVKVKRKGFPRRKEDFRLSVKNINLIENDPSRIYNEDETGFVLCPKQGKVLAIKGSKDVYEIDNSNSKCSLTVMFTFGADGSVTPLMVIYPYKRLPKSIAESVPQEWGIGISDTGWMKSEVFYEYIGNILHPHLVRKGIQFPIVLFVDGHKTQLSMQLSELCSKLKIILVALYPNATRVLQPADVFAFQPIKENWKAVVREWKRSNPGKDLTKTEFAPLLKTIIGHIKSRTIVNVFRACGLYPWNPQAINFDKCLGTSERKDPKDNKIQLKENKVLDYETFCEIVEVLKHFIQIKSSNYGNIFKLRKVVQKMIKKQKAKKEVHHESEENEDKTTERETHGTESSTNNNTQDEGFNYILTAAGITNLDQSHTICYDKIEDIPVVFGSDINIYENTNTNVIVIDNLTSSSDINNENDQFDQKDLGQKENLKKPFVWPDTPKRKNTKINDKEKMSYVITSSGWKRQTKCKSKKK